MSGRNRGRQNTNQDANDEERKLWKEIKSQAAAIDEKVVCVIFSQVFDVYSLCSTQDVQPYLLLRIFARPFIIYSVFEVLHSTTHLLLDLATSKRSLRKPRKSKLSYVISKHGNIVVCSFPKHTRTNVVPSPAQMKSATR